MKTTAVQTCRVCGCTDADCRQCIARTGIPCTWVKADLCSACFDGFTALIRVKRGETNIATVRVGGRTHRASCTSSDLAAVQAVAEKAAKHVRAYVWSVERYQCLSISAGRGALVLEFKGSQAS